jgi:hypothetical protein
VLPDPARRRALTALAFHSLFQGGVFVTLLTVSAALMGGALFGLLRVLF